MGGYVANVLLLRHFYQAAFEINLLICFCSLDLSCPILEKDIFIELYSQ